MNVWVAHTNATCIIAYSIPLAPLASFQAIGVGMVLNSWFLCFAKSYRCIREVFDNPVEFILSKVTWMNFEGSSGFSG